MVRYPMPQLLLASLIVQGDDDHCAFYDGGDAITMWGILLGTEGALTQQVDEFATHLRSDKLRLNAWYSPTKMIY